MEDPIVPDAAAAPDAPDTAASSNNNNNNNNNVSTPPPNTEEEERKRKQQQQKAAAEVAFMEQLLLEQEEEEDDDDVIIGEVEDNNNNNNGDDDDDEVAAIDALMMMEGHPVVGDDENGNNGYFEVVEEDQNNKKLPSLSYVQISLLAAFSMIWYALRTRQQFYLAVVYLQSSKWAYIVFGNAFIASCIWIFQWCTSYFLSPGLRVPEAEGLGDFFRWNVTETCLALTMFRNELTVKTGILFLILVLAKCLHWIAELRESHLRMTEEAIIIPETTDTTENNNNNNMMTTTSPTPTSSTSSNWRRRMKHLPYIQKPHRKLYTFLIVLQILDIMAVLTCAKDIMTYGPSVSILFAFESAILLTSCISSLLLWHLHVVDGIIHYLHEITTTLPSSMNTTNDDEEDEEEEEEDEEVDDDNDNDNDEAQQNVNVTDTFEDEYTEASTSMRDVVAVAAAAAAAADDDDDDDDDEVVQELDGTDTFEDEYTEASSSVRVTALAATDTTTNQPPLPQPQEQPQEQQQSGLVHWIQQSVHGWIHPWKDHKATLIFAVEVQAQASKFLFYISFFGIVLTYYGMPINLFREVYMSFISLKQRLVAFAKYRQLMASMNRFSNPSSPELEEAGCTCIICRDEMSTHTAKKLPGCGHMFHKSCLREWLVQQQTCPTCRGDITRMEQRQRQQEQADQAAQERQEQEEQQQEEEGPGDVAAAAETESTPTPPNETEQDEKDIPSVSRTPASRLVAFTDNNNNSTSFEQQDRKPAAVSFSSSLTKKKSVRISFPQLDQQHSSLPMTGNKDTTFGGRDVNIEPVEYHAFPAFYRVMQDEGAPVWNNGDAVSFVIRNVPFGVVILGLELQWRHCSNNDEDVKNYNDDDDDDDDDDDVDNQNKSKDHRLMLRMPDGWVREDDVVRVHAVPF